jgi:septal ring factor EnvC (AmiA/AmiB activator)
MTITVTDTYDKKPDGKVYLRHVETREDINGKEFTLQDQEVEFDHQKHLPQLQKKLADIRSEIAELESEETRLATKIAAVETARDAVVAKDL